MVNIIFSLRAVVVCTAIAFGVQISYAMDNSGEFPPQVGTIPKYPVAFLVNEQWAILPEEIAENVRTLAEQTRWNGRSCGQQCQSDFKRHEDKIQVSILHNGQKRSYLIYRKFVNHVYNGLFIVDDVSKVETEIHILKASSFIGVHQEK